ncbi:uncharacterized protein LOC127720779 [Mytilus californianus]|uniref:uncharacterized protein LOC127720779 n=1 Tax=Mytilus californianus TaxID=6549 RepID=UPI00224594E5|nr:uncharacterized protein LOC127720779 [Mytilus californianus]
MNVAASDQHKQYDLLVPLFLHNRPKTVVQHCMRRWVDSENSSLNDIDQTSPSTFLVKSFSDINTSLYYEVCFENDDEMPSCQCLDWLEHHLPCKHLMTVFRNVLNCNWDALPSAYRESPYICLDVESFPLDSEADLSTTDDNIVEVTIGSSGDMGEISVSSLPLPPKQQLKKERSKICNLLEITKERCYASENLKLLQKISATLTSLASELRQDLPKEGEFILDTTTESTHIGTNSSKQTDTRRSAVRKLSLSRKRKIPGSGRHGVGAQKKRNSHMKEGINTLIDLVEPAVVEEGVEIILMEDEDTVEILDSRPSQEVSFKNIDRGCAQRPPQGDQSDTVDRGAAPNPPQEDHPLRSGSLNTVMEANHDSEIQLIQETLNMEDICQTEDLSQSKPQ